MSTSIATQLPRPELDIDSIVKAQEGHLHPIERSLWESRQRESIIEQAEKYYREWECRIHDTPTRTLFTINGPNRTMDIEFRPLDNRNVVSYSIKSGGENGGNRSAVEAIEYVQRTYQAMVHGGLAELVRDSIAKWKNTLTLQDVLEYILSTNSLDASGDPFLSF